jgi:DNA-binding SARP family transcriptional activator
MGAGIPELRLTCFGPPMISVGGGEPPADVAWRKHLALLVYLALSPDRTRTRDHLIALLWPEKDEKSARHSLNEALRRLRASLGAERVLTQGPAVTLSDQALVVDARDFDEVARRDARAALELARGEFLEGFLIGDAAPFDEWAETQRARYRDRIVSLLVAAGERLLDVPRPSDARDAGRRALALSPFDETAVRLLMRSLTLSGDAAQALAAYREYAERLKSQVGESPSRELTALADRIRGTRWRRRATEATGEPAPPLTGREGIHRRVFAAVSDALARGSRVVVVSGGPGTGKTRLVDECLERVALDGGWVVAVRPLESDHDAPWSLLRLLLRSGLATVPGVLGASPEAVGVLAGFSPDLAERVRPVAAADAAQIAQALAAALAAATEERPLALAIDDAHFADGPSVGALGEAAAKLPRAPLLVILGAADPPSGAPTELLRLRSEVGRRVAGTDVTLSPFTDPEIRLLVEGMAPWCDEQEKERLARRMSFETRGSPLLAVTLLGALRSASLRDDLMAWPPPRSTYEAPLPFAVPPLVRAALMARIAQLGEHARRCLCAASVGGTGVDPGLVGRVAGLSAAAVEEALLELERLQLLNFEGNRHVLAAPLISEVVRSECLTRGELHRLQARAAEALDGRPELDSRALRAELLAALREPAAFQEAVNAARAAMEAGATRTARRCLSAAERVAPPDGATSQGQVRDLRARLG